MAGLPRARGYLTSPLCKSKLVSFESERLTRYPQVQQQQRRYVCLMCAIRRHKQLRRRNQRNLHRNPIRWRIYRHRSPLHPRHHDARKQRLRTSTNHQLWRPQPRPHAIPQRSRNLQRRQRRKPLPRQRGHANDHGRNGRHIQRRRPQAMYRPDRSYRCLHVLQSRAHL